jgi:hypothetical protein
LKRRLLLLLAAVAPSVVWVAPPAGALGAAACVISGTVSFDSPSTAPLTAGTGVWHIGPAQIHCNGVTNGYRIFGTGPFTGSGTYTALPAAGGSCFHHVGTGMVDYYIRSGAMVFHIQEAKRFLLAGAGEFTTPTLRGTLQLAPPYEGDCVTKPVTRATFVAQGAIVHREVLIGRPGPRS